MGNPLEKYIQPASQDPGKNPLEKYITVTSPGQADIASPITGGPGFTGFDQLLQRTDLSPEQRARIEGLRARFTQQTTGEQQGALAGIASAFAQGAAEVPASLIETAGKLGGSDRIQQAAASIPAALEPAPTQSTLGQVAQTAAYATGNAVAQYALFGWAARAAKLIGLGAEAVAPAATKSALTAIAQAAEKIGTYVPEAASGLAERTINALPRNATASLIAQAAQDPNSLTTPQGIATGIGFSLLGALTEGAARAQGLSALVREVKRPETVAAIGEIAKQEKASATLPTQLEAALNNVQQGPEGGIPSALQAAYKNIHSWHDQVAATIEERLAQLKQPETPLIQSQPEADPLVTAAKAGESAREDPELLQAGYLAAVDAIRKRAPWMEDAQVAKLAALEVGLKKPPENLITPVEVSRGQTPVQESTYLSSRNRPTDFVVVDEAAKRWAAGSDIPGAPTNHDPSVAVAQEAGPVRKAYGPAPGQEQTGDVVGRYLDQRKGAATPADPIISTKPSKGNPDYTNGILSQIHDPNEGKNLGLRGYVQDRWEFLYKHLVKSTAPLGKLTKGLYGDKIEFNNNIEAMADLTRGSASSLQRILEFGGMRFLADGNVDVLNTPGLKEIMAPLKTKGLWDEFRAYLIANRYVNDPNFREKATNINEAHANLQVANASQLVKDAAVKWVDWNRMIRQMAEDEGLLEQGMGKVFDDITDAYTYLPRAWEKGTVPGNVQQKSFTSAKDLFQRLIGGSKKYDDPIIASIDKASRTIRAIYRNRAIRTLADGIEQNPQKAGELGLARVVDANEVHTPELVAAANNFYENMLASGKEITKAEAMQATLLLSGKSVGGPNYVAYWDNGRVKRVRVPTEIVESFASLNPNELGFLTQALGLPAKGLKAGVTLSPVFQLYNFIRDSWDATLNSRYGFTFGLSSWKGFMEAVRKGEMHQEWLAAGGGFGGITSSNVRTPQLAFDLLRPQSGAVKFFTHPVEALKAFSAPIETAARLGEYMLARKAGASATEAAWASRSVTTDFSQIGLSTAAWAHMTAFGNPGLQSLDKMRLAIRDNPVGVFTKGIASITLPTILLYAANRNDDDIQRLRKSEAGLANWFTRLPDGTIAKVPKPFIYGQMFGTSMESALDKLTAADPRAMDRYLGALGKQAEFNMLPTAIQTYVSLRDNVDSQSGAPIVPLDAQDLTPPYQYGSNTSEFGKYLGSKLNMSPAKLDFVFGQLLGHTGRDLLRAGDVVAQDKNNPGPTPVAADLPLVGRLFARYPSLGVEPVQTFYRDAAKTGQVLATVSALSKDRPQEVETFLNEHKQDFVIGSVYAETRKQLSQLRNAIDLIDRAPGTVMKPDEKRAQIDYIMKQMITITEKVNGAVDQLRLSPEFAGNSR